MATSHLRVPVLAALLAMRGAIRSLSVLSANVLCVFPFVVIVSTLIDDYAELWRTRTFLTGVSDAPATHGCVPRLLDGNCADSRQDLQGASSVTKDTSLRQYQYLPGHLNAHFYSVCPNPPSKQDSDPPRPPSRPPSPPPRPPSPPPTYSAPPPRPSFYPRTPNTQPPEAVLTLKTEGNRAFMMGLFERAMRKYDEAIRAY